MLSETLADAQAAPQKPSSGKTESETNRFVIRIPRSAAASPRASTETLGEAIADSAKCSSIPPLTSSNESTIMAGQPSPLTEASHWSQSAPVAQLNNNNEAPISIQSPDSPAAKVTDKSKLQLSTFSLPKQSTSQGTLDGLPKKEGEYEGAVAIEYGPHSSKETFERERVPNAYLGCIEYEPFKLLHRHPDFHPGASIDVRIPLKYIEGGNPAVRRRCAWGGAKNKELYTDDSDPVCVILHSTKGEIPADCSHIRATLRVMPALKEYKGCPSSRTGFKSRSWKRHSGHSIQLVDVRPCGPASRRKKRTGLGLNDQYCSVKFSSLSMTPILNFIELLFLANVTRGRLQTRSLHLIGHQQHYTLSSLEIDRKQIVYQLLRGKDTVLFNDLKWEEIGWVDGGLTIRNTFLNLHGYHW